MKNALEQYWARVTPELWAEAKLAAVSDPAASVFCTYCGRGTRGCCAQLHVHDLSEHRRLPLLSQKVGAAQQYRVLSKSIP